MKTSNAILTLAIAALFCIPAAAKECKVAPVAVTVDDMLTKLYCAVPDTLERDNALETAFGIFLTAPREDEYGWWLDKDDGYFISYYGMDPDVSAMAYFDPVTGLARNYCLFFIFPYEAGTRELVNKEVSDFCGTLVQELADRGMQPGVNILTDALFEVVGEYENRAFDIILSDEAEGSPMEGNYLLSVSVNPGITAEEMLAAR